MRKGGAIIKKLGFVIIGTLQAIGTVHTEEVVVKMRLINSEGIIHAGGDNYSDHPKDLGGGGAHAACGIVE
jgi:Cu-Zn family superoxide dismutase